MNAPTLYELIICGIAIAIMTVEDIREGKISPPICLILVILAAFEPAKDYLAGLYGALIGFIPLFLCARFGGGGDGDALVAAAIGFTVPMRFEVYFLFTSSVVYVAVLAIAVLRTKNKYKQYPYLPFMAIGFVITVIYTIFTTGVIV